MIGINLCLPCVYLSRVRFIAGIKASFYGDSCALFRFKPT